jgi:hypothetical protein
MPNRRNRNKSKRPRRTGNADPDSRPRQQKYPSTWMVDRLCPFPPPGSFNYKVHDRVDSIQNLAYFTTSTTSNVFVGTFFALSSMGDASALATVFDQYRIMSVECTFTPTSQIIAGLTGKVLSAIDYDDVASTSPSIMAEKSTCLQTNLQDTWVRSFTPRIALATYSGAFTSYSIAPPHTWINTASTTVQHYGLKVTTNPTVTAITYDLYIRVHFQFRNTI